MNMHRYLSIAILLFFLMSTSLAGSSAAQPADGETINYTYTGSKETVDISNINKIEIVRMEGAEGGQEKQSPGNDGGMVD